MQVLVNKSSNLFLFARKNATEMTFFPLYLVLSSFILYFLPAEDEDLA